MKRTKICAVLLACAMGISVMSGCSQAKNSAGSSVSDTGISVSIDPNMTGGSNGAGASDVPSYVGMTYEDNYDQAAIDEMNKQVTIHGMQFSSLEYNFYFANEYTTMLSMSLRGGSYAVPMTDAGFLDMNAALTEEKTVREYLQEVVVSDLQGEAFLLEYAQEKNLVLPQDVIDSIEDQFSQAEESATNYGITLEDYLKSYYGPEATVDGMRQILQRYEMINYAMQDYVDNYQFQEGEDMLPTVYHVLYPTIDLATRAALSEEEQNIAKQRAEDTQKAATSLDALKTKADEDVNAGIAAEASQYTVSRGQMVEEFEDWCFETHNVGDVDIVLTMYGYHVMYFVGQEQANDEQKRQIAYTILQRELDDAIASGLYDPTFA